MKKLYFLATILLHFTTYAQNGQQFNGNHTIDSVTNLLQVSTPKNGMEIYVNSDSTLHIYSGACSCWRTQEDSLHTLKIIAAISGIQPYVNTATTATGIATFYLTTDKTSTGVALFTTVGNVTPFINDAANNYTYGYAIVGKILTVTCKVSSQNSIALVGLTLLGVPALVTNGTSVNVTVYGK